MSFKEFIKYLAVIIFMVHILATIIPFFLTMILIEKFKKLPSKVEKCIFYTIYIFFSFFTDLLEIEVEVEKHEKVSFN